MTVAEHLDALRRQHPDCLLAAYGDLAARLVLRSSSDGRRPQEYLDALCCEAGRSFAMLDAAAAGGARPDAVTVLAPAEARLFLRAVRPSQDAILCICSSRAAAARLEEPARALLAAAQLEA